MTLLQRDRENIELGREEGSNQMASLIKILLSEDRTDDFKTCFRRHGFQE